MKTKFLHEFRLHKAAMLDVINRLIMEQSNRFKAVEIIDNKFGLLSGVEMR